MASFISSTYHKILGCLKSFTGSNSLISRSSSSTSIGKWKILKVNHVAVATADLEKSVCLYRDILGAKTSGPTDLPEHGVTTVFVDLNNTKFELLKPLGEKSPIKNFLEKNSAGGMHHVCIEVDNIKNAVHDLQQNNIRLLSDEPKIGAHGKPVIFLHPKDCGGVLIELEEV